MCKQCAEISMKEAYIDALSQLQEEAYFNALITVLKEQAKYNDRLPKGKEDNLRICF